MIRDDLTDRLVHLTKGDTDEIAAQNFLSIVKTRTLRGGVGLIKGGYRCICFTEAPISKLGSILAQPSIHVMPYAPLGVMLTKTALFAAGGRPVVYQPDSEFERLDESIRYRHKAYDPGRGVDFSWEREWRLLADSLPLDPEAVTLVVPNRAWSDYLFRCHAEHLSVQVHIGGTVAPLLVNPCPWHFLVLEDLGVAPEFTYVPR